jgi:FtsP/CotA-like multicopper oxidase with cupredoxin domain
MKTITSIAFPLFVAALAFGPARPAAADIIVQCPGDTDGDAVIDSPDPSHSRAKCMHLAAGDGYVRMADGLELYAFGFSDVTGLMPDMIMHESMLASSFPAPTIVLEEGDEFYLTLSNVGMTVRSDLNDPHTVHFHGFPQAAAIFDGLPEASVAINMMSSFTYYYNIVHPGTFIYHCHVEAVEHMQMGMLGQLYIKPAQNRLPDGTSLNGFVHHAGYQYAYNDGDGSTRYDVEFPLQLGSFDDFFHQQDETFQPPPFYLLHDNYPMINGRGYPDTINPAPLAPPVANGGKVSQPLSSLIRVQQGQRALVRLSNLNITRFYTVQTTGLPLLVVAKDAKLLRGPTGLNHYYTTYSMTTGGGETTDAIIDTAGIPKGTYFLYATNLNYLSNSSDDFGGMMTEIVVE